jgi:hypothetical protein
MTQTHAAPSRKKSILSMLFFAACVGASPARASCGESVVQAARRVLNDVVGTASGSGIAVLQCGADRFLGDTTTIFFGTVDGDLPFTDLRGAQWADGTHILAEQTLRGAGRGLGSRLLLIDAVGLQSPPLTTGADGLFMTAFSAGTGKIAAVQLSPSGMETVRIFDLSLGHLTAVEDRYQVNLPLGNYSHLAFSPDGKQFAYSSWEGKPIARKRDAFVQQTGLPGSAPFALSPALDPFVWLNESVLLGADETSGAIRKCVVQTATCDDVYTAGHGLFPASILRAGGAALIVPYRHLDRDRFETRASRVEVVDSDKWTRLFGVDLPTGVFLRSLDWRP